MLSSQYGTAMHRILVLGYYDRGNLGDEMFKETMPLVFPSCRLTFLSTDSITPKSVKTLNDDYDAIITGGGDIVSDYFHRKIKMATQNFHGPVFGFSMGIPYHSLIEQGYLDLYDHLYLRERTDVRKLQKRMGTGYVHWLPDLGFKLSPTIDSDKYGEDKDGVKQDKDDEREANNGKVIGVCPIQSIFSNSAVVDSLGEFLQRLVKEEGYTIRLLRFNSNGKLTEDDRYINQRLAEIIGVQEKRVILDETIYNVDQMLTVLAECDYTICMRLHSHIFSTVVGTPFLSIYPTRKVGLFLQGIGCEKYGYQIPRKGGDRLTQMDVEQLMEKFRIVASNHSEMSEKLNDVYQLYHQMLETEQPEKMLIQMIENGTRRGKTLRHVDALSVEKIYQDVRDKMIDLTGFDPVIKDNNSIDKNGKGDIDDTGIRCQVDADAATQLTEMMLVRITGQVENQYSHGSIQNIQSMPEKLREMIDWTVKDHQSETEKHRNRLNLTYLNQDNFQGIHRSGWQYCLDYMRSLHADDGVICDVYLDRTFHWGQGEKQEQSLIPYNSPWIGFLHHCPNQEYTQYNTVEMLQNPNFIQSLPMCQGIFTLSKYLRDWLQEHIPIHVPVVNLHHPTQFVDSLNNLFTMEKFIGNSERSMINVGGWYRNPFSIHRLDITTIQVDCNRCNGYNKIINLFSKCLPCCGNKNREDVNDDRSKNDGSKNDGLRGGGKRCSDDCDLVMKNGCYYFLNRAALKGRHMGNYFNPGTASIKISKVSDRFMVDVPTLGSSSNATSTISVDPTARNRWVHFLEEYLNDDMDELHRRLGFEAADIPEVCIIELGDDSMAIGDYEAVLRGHLLQLINSVKVIDYLPNDEYDRLLSENIVFLHLMDCSAVNTIIECMVRNTPLVVNRLPAVVEYLGEEYPLYYHDLSEVPMLMTVERIRRATEYLAAMDKTFLRITSFIDGLKNSQIYKSI